MERHLENTAGELTSRLRVLPAEIVRGIKTACRSNPKEDIPQRLARPYWTTRPMQAQRQSVKSLSLAGELKQVCGKDDAGQTCGSNEPESHDHGEICVNDKMLTLYSLRVVLRWRIHSFLPSYGTMLDRWTGFGFDVEGGRPRYIYP